jgi:hypothetical protein
MPAPGCSRGQTEVLEMFVRLNAGAHLKPPGTPAQPYRVRRLVKSLPVWSGALLCDNGIWLLHSGDDDDPVWIFEAGPLRPGEYLTLRGPAGDSLMFRILDVGFPKDRDNSVE